MEKLKPCPFCGYEYPLMRESEYNGFIEISCENCDIRFRLGPGAKEKMKERIISAWNRRTIDEKG